MAKLLFFCPEGHVLTHLALMAVTARTMHDRGHEVALTRCFDLFPRCVPKSTHAKTDWPRDEQLSVCKICSENQQSAVDRYGLPTVDLGLYVTPAVQAEAARIVDEAIDLLQLAYDGEQIGHMAAFLYTLRFKGKPDVNDPPERRIWFREQVLTTLTTFIAVSRLLDEATYTHLVVFNFYPPNQAAMRAAYRHGIEVRILTHPSHAGVDRRFAWVMREETREYFHDLLEQWPSLRLKSLRPDEVVQAGLDAVCRLSATSIHIYSPTRTPQADYRTVLSLPKDKPIVAIFTSSPDENIAADFVTLALKRPDHSGPEIFADEASWLLALRDFAIRRPGISFVVRMHPRLDGNRREPMRSPHLDILEKALTSGPPNWHVYWPKDSASSYDILEIADLALTSWSSMGLESARLGVPALMAFWHNMCVPYDDFVAGRDTLEGYFTAIDEMIGSEANLDQILRAFRFHMQANFSAAVSLEDVIPTPNYADLPEFSVPKNAALLEEALIGATPLQHLRLNDFSTDGALARWEERGIARWMLIALVRFLLLGVYDFPAPKVQFTTRENALSADPPAEGTAIAGEHNNICVYREGGETVERYSAMVGRLIRLLINDRR